ncbi:hypothetical protein OROMI_012679 [Orobanche minor]
MEDVEIETAPLVEHSKEDFCSDVLSQFCNSNNEHHLHICAVIGAMSQELVEQNLPLTHTAYFGATCSSLDRLSSSIDPPGHLLDALLTIMSLVLDRFSHAVLRTKYCYLSELIIRILGMKSVGVNGVVPGMKFATRLLIVREKVGWADVAQLYNVLTSYISDERLKRVISTSMLPTHSFFCPATQVPESPTTNT